jgi:hypothetical protein
METDNLLLLLFQLTNRLVSDSEQIGMSTLMQMNTQREQMQIASDSMNNTINATAQARALLRKM